jgi:hypothetical protein
MREACGFCGDTTGPFTRIEGLFEVLMCPRCQHDRGHSPGPYPAMTQAQLRASLDLLPHLGPSPQGAGQPRPDRRSAPPSRR